MKKEDDLIYDLIFSDVDSLRIDISEYVEDIYKYEEFISKIKKVLKKKEKLLEPSGVHGSFKYIQINQDNKLNWYKYFIKV